ncbi:MAG: hypothetical protein WDW36_007858 [Sanguina aurantia]
MQETDSHIYNFLRSKLDLAVLKVHDVSVVGFAESLSSHTKHTEELSALLLVNVWLSGYALLAMVTSSLFLGRMSSRETTRLAERMIKFVVFKIIVVRAVMTHSLLEMTMWMAWLTSIAYMRVFVGAAKDRLEMLAAAPASTNASHARALSLLSLTLLQNVAAAVLLVQSLGQHAPSKTLLLGFDCVIIAVDGAKTLMRYVVHMGESGRVSLTPPSFLVQLSRRIRKLTQAVARPFSGTRRTSPLVDQSHQRHSRSHAAGAGANGSGGGERVMDGGGGWANWDGHGVLLYHVELVTDLGMHVLTLTHYLHVWVLHGLAFQLIDAVLLLDVHTVASSLNRRVTSYLAYRAATDSLTNAFPDVRMDDGDGENSCECTICLERIQVGKRLPCSHVYHLGCLRALLQQSGSSNFTCPLCRFPLSMGPAAAGRRLNAVDRVVARATTYLQDCVMWLLLMFLASNAVRLRVSNVVEQQRIRRSHHHRDGATNLPTSRTRTSNPHVEMMDESLGPLELDADGGDSDNDYDDSASDGDDGEVEEFEEYDDGEDEDEGSEDPDQEESDQWEQEQPGVWRRRGTRGTGVRPGGAPTVVGAAVVTGPSAVPQQQQHGVGVGSSHGRTASGESLSRSAQARALQAQAPGPVQPPQQQPGLFAATASRLASAASGSLLGMLGALEGPNVQQLRAEDLRQLQQRRDRLQQQVLALERDTAEQAAHEQREQDQLRHAAPTLLGLHSAVAAAQAAVQTTTTPRLAQHDSTAPRDDGHLAGTSPRHTPSRPSPAPRSAHPRSSHIPPSPPAQAPAHTRRPSASQQQQQLQLQPHLQPETSPSGRAARAAGGASLPAQVGRGGGGVGSHDGAGPSPVTQQQQQRARRGAQPPRVALQPEPSTWSGGAAQVMTRRVSQALSSARTHGGSSNAALAGRGDDGFEEVSSAPTTAPPAAAAAAAGRTTGAGGRPPRQPSAGSRGAGAVGAGRVTRRSGPPA